MKVEPRIGPTLPELFKEYMTLRIPKTFRQYQAELAMDSIYLMKKLGWPLFLVTPRQKYPKKGTHPLEISKAGGISAVETEKWMTRDHTEILGYQTKHQMTGNIACYAGYGKFVILDWDGAEIPKAFKDLYQRTLTIRTARGFQFLIEQPDEKTYDKWMPLVLGEYQNYTDDNGVSYLETWKNDHYTILPTSITCANDHKQGKESHPFPWGGCLKGGTKHDYHIRLFNDTGLEPLPFEESIKVLMK